MRRTQSEKDEDTSWISGTVVWLQGSGDKIQSARRSESNGRPVRACQLPYITELDGANVEFLECRKSGESCSISRDDRAIHYQFVRSLLYDLGAAEECVVAIENRFAFQQKRARPPCLSIVLVRPPDERGCPLSVGTEMHSVQHRGSHAVQRFLGSQRVVALHKTVAAGNAPLSAGIQ